MTKIAQITAKIGGGGVALALVSFVNLAPADAATFTFNSADNGLSTITKTVDGITLTISNPSTGNLIIDDNGLCVLGFNNGFCSTTNSLDLVFDKNVQLISYRVGFNSFTSGDQIVTLTNGDLSSIQTDFTDEATINFTNQLNVLANETISVSGDIGSETFMTTSLQWREITVSEVMFPPSPPVTTPEPMSLVALLGVGALGFATRKKK